jgi:hypothetical protein
LVYDFVASKEGRKGPAATVDLADKVRLARSVLQSTKPEMQHKLLIIFFYNNSCSISGHELSQKFS